MGHLLAKLYWALRPFAKPRTEALALRRRVTGLACRVDTLEAELRRLRSAGWPVPPGRVVALRPELMDDN